MQVSLNMPVDPDKKLQEKYFLTTDTEDMTSRIASLEDDKSPKGSQRLVDFQEETSG